MKQWQSIIGILGSVLWITVVFNLEHVLKSESESLTAFVGGYVFTFIAAFVGYLIWNTPTGTILVFFKNTNLIEDIQTSVMLSFLFFFAALTTIATLAGWTTWEFNVSAMLAAFVVNQGLGPLLESLEPNMN